MIVRARGGGQVHVRDVTLAAMVKASGGELRASGTSVTPRDVAGLPAWKQGIRIAAEAIMRHEIGVWRGRDVDRRQVSTTWQARLFAAQPNEWYSWAECLEMTEGSLTARANAYWLKNYDDAGRVEEVFVVHPDDIQPRWNREAKRIEYRVRLFGGGFAPEFLTTREILHFRIGHSSPASLVAPSPIEEHRGALSAAVTRTRKETEVYDGGLAQSVAVVFPDNVTPEQAEKWKEVYLGGDLSTSGVKVFGGNPNIESIGLSASDMQFIESQSFSVYDVGRILGVPPSLLWAAIAGNDKPLSPEHEEDRWFRHGLSPRRLRIEQTIRRDPAFFGPGARDYPLLTTDAVRGDVAAESEALVREVQSGILLVDEARAKRGYPPLPNGAGQIPQITPVGGAPNEQPSPGASDDDSDDDDERSRRVRRQEIVVPEVRVEIPELRLEPRIELRPEIRVEQPEIRVEVPKQDAPEIRVELPEQPAPVVNVSVEPTPVTVEANVEVVQPPRRFRIGRDAHGFITGGEIEDAETDR